MSFTSMFSTSNTTILSIVSFIVFADRMPWAVSSSNPPVSSDTGGGGWCSIWFIKCCSWWIPKTTSQLTRCIEVSVTKLSTNLSLNLQSGWGETGQEKVRNLRKSHSKRDGWDGRWHRLGARIGTSACQHKRVWKLREDSSKRRSRG